MQTHTYPTVQPPEPLVAVQAAPMIVQMAAPSQVVPEQSLTTSGTCLKPVLTNMKIKKVGKIDLWGSLLCIIGCWPCLIIAYCMRTCSKAVHYCRAAKHMPDPKIDNSFDQ